MKICPQCKKVSYLNERLQHTKCRHCGFLLHAWTEKRVHPRIAAQHESTILAGKDVYYGQCVDLSYKGFRIAYDGQALGKGIRIDIAVDDINAMGKAEVVWSRQYSAQKAHVGIKMI